MSVAAARDSAGKSRTGYVWHERYMWHYAGKYTWKLVDIQPRLATVEELTRFHTPEYVRKIEQLSQENGGDAGDFATFSKGGYDIARLSAGGVIAAVDAIMDGKVENAYALVRPPGHHAERDRGMGFCLFNNVVIAILHAKVKYGLKRIACVDFDVHHGNGSQQAFYYDPDTLFISIHQDSNYPPDVGTLEERGEGAGLGSTINIPLPPGAGGGTYAVTFDRVVVPALQIFRPELIVVSSGFDAAFLDPLGTMMLSSEDFRRMTAQLKQVAMECCEGKMVFAHEGGYSDLYVPFCGLAVLEELSGIRTEADDILRHDVEGWGYRDLQPHQDTVIRKAEEAVKDLKDKLNGAAAK